MKVLIFQQRGWGIKFGHYLATRIKIKYPDARFYALVFKDTTMKFIQRQSDLTYEKIVLFDDLQNNPEKYISRNVSLSDICDKLNIGSVWPMMQSMRLYVRDYAKKYYYSYRKRATDDEMRNIIKSTFCLIEGIFEEFSPDLVITPNFVSIPHIIMSLYAEKLGIKVLSIADTKIRGVYIWVYNHFASRGRFFNVYNNFLDNENIIDGYLKERAKLYLEKFRNEYIAPEYMEKPSVSFKMSSIINYSYLKRAVRNNKFLLLLASLIRGNRSKSIYSFTTPDNRNRRIILRDYFAERSYRREVLKWKFDILADGENYAYFPLQFQPEASLDVIAPHFNNQIEVVRQAAMSLPGDMVLVVKEHPAMIGKRPPSYLEKIQKLPNVKFVDYKVRSYDLIKNAKIVITINSTASIEGAFLGIPSIQFGNLGTTLLLPHVTKCTDFTNISNVISRILEENFKSDKYDKYLISYIAAAYKTGFELDYGAIWEFGAEGNLEPLWDSLRDELESD